MHVEFNEVMVELMTGDISDQPDCDAIVNAANAQLKSGGGVAGAIHGKGDPELEELTRPLAPIKPGEAVITEAPNLPNKYVVHCLGPVYGKDKPEEELLKKCYQNALQVAEENKIESIVFPALSTGAFGYPMKEAAQVAFSAVKEKAAELNHVKYIRFVLYSAADYNLHLQVFKEY
ncbi:macro domain-containing protein [Rhodohalobacter halophilus]|uniref:macro domain-containing protein n=1 Tax=Rhodohalobacter halophilus TaxID=1812810 RepID=UPI00083FCF29|nr:macro domain-containing protein [Rhodohalobacter halophilus]